MKKLMFRIVVICTIVFATSCASTPTEPMSYSQIIIAKDISVNDLYTKANLWFVDVFRDARSVIQYSDKAEGVLKGKYYMSNITDAWGNPIGVMTTLTVEVKEGRCKISFDNPSYSGKSIWWGNEIEGNVGLDTPLGNNVMSKWKSLAVSLENALNSTPEDW